MSCMGSKGFECTFQANVESEVKIDKLEARNLAKNRLLKITTSRINTLSSRPQNGGSSLEGRSVQECKLATAGSTYMEKMRL